jgi:transcriptional regulator with XRE-family HTH domain
MDAFDRIAARTPQETKRFVSKMLDIVDRIHEILEAKGMAQKDLAKALGKSESEISKWLTGTHNLELKTIAKIEEVLGEDILAVTSVKKVQSGSVVAREHNYYGGPFVVEPHVEVMAWPAMTKFIMHELSERQPKAKSFVVCRFNTQDVTFGVGIVPKAQVNHLKQRFKDIVHSMLQNTDDMPDEELTFIDFGK